MANASGRDVAVDVQNVREKQRKSIVSLMHRILASMDGPRIARLDDTRDAPVIQAAMHQTFKAIALLLFAATAFSQPVITSISPSSGPVTGGTAITIHGSGFTDVCTVGCAGARTGINVGDLFITSYRVIDANTIVATTPAHLPGTYSIERVQNDGTSRAPHSFTFEGDPADAFDRLLLPVFIPVTPGAFDS